MVPRRVLHSIGGFDTAFRSRVTTELFWRLNPVCSLDGVASVTYQLVEHPGPRISGDRALRQSSFQQLIATHRAVLRDHPDGYADLLVEHARSSAHARQPAAAVAALARAVRLQPVRTLTRLGAFLRGGLPEEPPPEER